MAALALLLSALLSAAAPVILPGQLYSGLPKHWAPFAAAHRVAPQTFVPIARELETRGETRVTPEVLQAVRARMAAEAERVLADASPVGDAQAAMLASDYAAFLEPGVVAKLSNRKVEQKIDALAKALGVTKAEAASYYLPELPAELANPKIIQLRLAGKKPVPHVESKAAGKVAALQVKHAAKTGVARLYRPLLNVFRALMEHAGELYRKYISGREMDSHNFRWHVIEKLHKEGDFRGSFGHPVYDGMPEVMSPMIFPAEHARKLRSQVVRGPGGIELSPMIGISGMSFPQLSAQSHLSLIYIHLKLAKELGVRQVINTGEGGPGLHLALLSGDRQAVTDYIVDWNVRNGQFAPGSWSEAKVVHFIDELMKSRDKLFAEFTPEDIAKAQVVAQFGSALNGIRGAEGRADFDKVAAVAANPYVRMIQYKLKQAAKRGAKVDPKKMDDVVGAWRETPRDKPLKSPELNPELDSDEHIARLILATREVTGKPVSLKFGVGKAQDLYERFKYLRDAGALPDHIQLDGRGDEFSPGSGNAPPGANTSLPSNEAILVMDAVLRKLGVRDRIFIEATGDVLLPAEGVEKLALGADGISGGRLWMGMGLGCAKVKACANGSCPYGIAARSDSIMGLALDPTVIGPRGYQAAANWWKSYTQTLAEAGDDLRGSVRKKAGHKSLSLDAFYDPEYVADLLK